MFTISCWRGRRSCQPGHPFYCPAVLPRWSPFCLSASICKTWGEGRYVTGMFWWIYKVIQSSKNPFGGGSGSEEYSVFHQEAPLISWVLVLSPFLLAFKSYCSSLWKVEVRNSNSYWYETICRMNWTGYYGFITCFFSLDKVILKLFPLCPASSNVRLKRTMWGNFLLFSWMMKNGGK